MRERQALRTLSEPAFFKHVMDIFVAGGPLPDVAQSHLENNAYGIIDAETFRTSVMDMAELRRGRGLSMDAAYLEIQYMWLYGTELSVINLVDAVESVALVVPVLCYAMFNGWVSEAAFDSAVRDRDSPEISAIDSHRNMFRFAQPDQINEIKIERFHTLATFGVFCGREPEPARLFDKIHVLADSLQDCINTINHAIDRIREERNYKRAVDAVHRALIDSKDRRVRRAFHPTSAIVSAMQNGVGVFMRESARTGGVVVRLVTSRPCT